MPSILNCSKHLAWISPSESDAPSPEETAEKRKLRMFVLAFLDEMLVKKLPAFSQGRFTDEKLDEILQQVQ
ncbi:MAG: hypothetical protein WBW78_17450 [Terrimicrobiaceae bacterium]